MALYQKRIDDFFQQEDNTKTFNNLCIHLDMTKDTFLQHLNQEPEIFIRAIERCEAWLIDNGLSNPKSGNFTQFLLRHNHDYTEHQQEEQNTPSEIKISLA